MEFLKQVLSHDNMRVAWEEVASKKGAPGIDGISIARWRRRWEENLYNLSTAVLTNTYKPSPPKFFYLPKKTGGLAENCNSYHHRSCPATGCPPNCG